MRLCPVCNTKGDFLYKIDKSSMLKCPSCKTQYTDPALKGEYGVEYTREPCEIDKLAIQDEAYYLVMNYEADKVLDYGSGNDYFLSCLPDYVEKTSFDPFLGKSPVLKTGYYDVVKLRGVIEHLEKPREVIKHIHSLLKPGGVLAVLTMDMDSRFARIKGKDYYMIDENYHITYFTLDSLKLLLSSEGFKVVDVLKPYYGVIPIVGNWLHGNLIEVYAVKK